MKTQEDSVEAVQMRNQYDRERSFFSVVHLAASMHKGGAARAAARIHEALTTHQNYAVRSSAVSALNEPEVGRHIAGLPHESLGIRRRVAAKAAQFIVANGRDPGNFYSFPLVRTGIGALLPKYPDWILFHWLGTRTMSYSEINALSGKKAWYAHDLWIAQVTEHLPLDINGTGPRISSLGYTHLTHQKRKILDGLHGVIAPSAQMAERIHSSALTKNLPIEVAAPPLDCDRWRPLERESARRALGISSDAFVVGFAADGGLRVPWKGGSDFVEACHRVAKSGVDVFPVVAGTKGPVHELRIPNLSIGRVDQVDRMQLFFACTDAIVCPSAFESFGQVASEAHAMARPVVAYGGSGMDSIVADGETGLLVQHDPESLAEAIIRLANDPAERREMGNAARLRAERLWSYAPASERLVSAIEALG